MSTPASTGAAAEDAFDAFDLETDLQQLLDEGAAVADALAPEEPVDLVTQAALREEVETHLGAHEREHAEKTADAERVRETVDLVTQAALGAEVESHLEALERERAQREAEAERVREAFRGMPAPTSRPVISISTNPPAHPAHLDDTDISLVQVPADGMCLFHCAVACRSLREWSASHGPSSGLAIDDAARQRDVQRALEVRDAVMMAAVAAGNKKAADRLKLPGSDGYPGQDELPYLSVVMGGQIVLQSGDVQEVIGTGPLVAHLCFLLSVDGEGHASGHFAVHQSWMHLSGALKRSCAGALESGRGTDGQKAPRLDVGAPMLPAEGSGSAPEGAPLAAPGGCAADGRAGASTNRQGGEAREAQAERGREGVAETSEPGSVRREAEPRAPVPPAASGAGQQKGAGPAQPACVSGLLDELSDCAGGLEGRPERKDVFVDADDIVDANRQLYRTAAEYLADERAQQVAVVLLIMYRLRLVDMSMKEYVHVIHAIEGDRFLRAHNGTLYLYADGAWRAFCGIFPVSVLTRVRRVLLLVEGFLRTLPANTPRTDVGVLKALREATAGARGVQGWMEAAELSVLRGGEAGDGDSAGWGPWLAQTVSKVRATATSLLCAKKVVPFLVEWCDTPICKAQGFSSKDACFLFEKDGAGMRQVKKSPDHNVYMYVPQSLHDPVLATNAQRLRRFLSTTFFQNEPALRCHFAAFALVLRGFNIDRAFWTLGQGGVGQSLLSHLVSSVFAENHAFLDMNMYYTDDELRKQGELLCGKAVVTGQEMPNCTKEMREDLYKKHVSADPVSCRLPYAVVTKQIQLEGLKRFEMNQPPRFTSTGEGAFNSILRRSLVVELRGNFLTQGEIDALFPDGGAEEAGYFVKDPTLKEFLTSPGAVGAFLRMLEGFLLTRSTLDCREIIESYVVGGGDGGLTRGVMRAACGLPYDDGALHHQGHGVAQPSTPAARAGAPQPCTPASPGVQPSEAPHTPPRDRAASNPVTPDRARAAQSPRPRGPAHEGAVSPRPAPVSPRPPVPRVGLWSSMLERERASLAGRSLALIAYCLDNGIDLVNKTTAPRLTAQVWQGMSQRDRGILFDKLVTNGLWRLLPRRGNVPQPCIPVVEARQDLQSVFPQWGALQGPLPEKLDARRGRDVVMQEDRAFNDAVMLQFFEASAKCPDGTAGRGAGRLSKDLDAASREWQEHAEDARLHVQTMSALRDFVRTWSRANSSTCSPSQRESVVTMHTDYSHKHGCFGRYYGKGLCFQSLCRRLRGVVQGVDVEDWDIRNCMVVLTAQLVEKIGIVVDSPVASLPAWKRYAEDPTGIRAMLARSFGIKAKTIALKVANGGSWPECVDAEALSFLSDLSKEARLLRWWSCNLVPDVHRFALDNPKKHSWPENTAFHYVWTTVESQCLMAAVDFVRTSEVKHLSLHFDGLMVDATRCRATPGFGASTAQAIQSSTGFRVELVQKTSETFFEMVRSAGTVVRDVADPSGCMRDMLKTGFSVPLALAHAVSDYQGVGTLAAKPGGPRRRTYADWFRLCDRVLAQPERTWAPMWGLRLPEQGHFLVHAEGEGRPTCACFSVASGGSLFMYHGRTIVQLGAQQALLAYEKCSDRSTVVTFAPEPTPASTAAPRFQLLQLRAG